jgi:hypothetical protein
MRLNFAFALRSIDLDRLVFQVLDVPSVSHLYSHFHPLSLSHISLKMATSADKSRFGDDHAGKEAINGHQLSSSPVVLS